MSEVPAIAEKLTVLLGKATPGIWQCSRIPGSTDSQVWVDRGNEGNKLICDADDDDAALIVAAINALPLLLDHINSEPARTKAAVEKAVGPLREALGNCAYDLEAEIEARYGNGIKDYPAMRRRYEQDMQVVNDAHAALATTTETDNG